MALDANNGNIYDTAKQFGLPRQTVNDWSRRRDEIFEKSQEEGEKRRLSLSRRLTLMINQISDSLPSKVEQARLGDATRALSILIDLQDTLAAKEAAEEAENSDVYEKLARLMERFAPANIPSGEADGA